MTAPTQSPAPTQTDRPASSATEGDQRQEPGTGKRMVAVGPLPLARCWELLATDTVGRLTYTAGALPAVAPVTYALAGDTLLLRIEPNIDLTEALNNAVVTFQADCVDRDELIGWQITVTGFARFNPCTPHNSRTVHLEATIVAGRHIQLD
jgi:pyridoxamine 5'-phosphate oxidase-like protein